MTAPGSPYGRFVLFLVVGLLVTTAGPTPVLAQGTPDDPLLQDRPERGALWTDAVGSVGADAASGSGDDSDRNEVRIVDEELTIEDATITIRDVSIEDTGLEKRTIDSRSATIEQATVDFDGLTLGLGDTDVRFCRFTLHIEEVGVAVENVTIS